MLFAATKKHSSPERQRPHRPRNTNKREPVVGDLRDKLNRKRQEKTRTEVGSSRAPPRDPAYNFLRDPLRGDESFSPVSDKRLGRKSPNVRSEPKRDPKSDSAAEGSGSRRVDEWVKSCYDNYAGQYNKRGGSSGASHSENWRSHSARQDELQSRDSKETINRFIQPSLNIMVQVSCTSGERKCTIDATKPLQTPIKVQQDSAKPNSRRHPAREAQKYYVSKSRQNPATAGFEKPQSMTSTETIENEHHTDDAAPANSNDNQCKSETTVDEGDTKEKINEDTVTPKPDFTTEPADVSTSKNENEKQNVDETNENGNKNEDITKKLSEIDINAENNTHQE